MTTTNESTTALSRANVEQISDARSEPQWLREYRLAAWDLYEQMEWPPHNQDGWRRIDLRKINLDDFTPAPTDADATPLLEKRSGLVISAGSNELSDELKAQGVIFTTLEEAIKTLPAQLTQLHLGAAIKSSLNRFTALNAAMWTGGLFLYVPKDIRIELPLHAMLAANAGATFSRILVLVDKFADVTLVTASQSSDEASVFNAGVTELYVGEGARLRYAHVQQWGVNTADITFQRAVLNQNSKLDLINVALGGKISRTQVDADLGTGSETMLTGLYFPRGEQYMEFDTLQDHSHPHTSSNLLYKGVIEDSGHSVFEGMILVRPEGTQSSSGMTNRNLLLSKTAHADSVPNLEIKANDILKCSHASSLGPVDTEALFYLMSRGIPAEIAKQIVVEGFLGEVLNTFALPELQAKLGNAIKTKLGVSSDLDVWSNEE